MREGERGNWVLQKENIILLLFLPPLGTQINETVRISSAHAPDQGIKFMGSSFPWVLSATEPFSRPREHQAYTSYLLSSKMEWKVGEIVPGGKALDLHQANPGFNYTHSI